MDDGRGLDPSGDAELGEGYYRALYAGHPDWYRDALAAAQLLADFITTAATDGDPAQETLRRLMRRVLEHQADQIQDDASVVILAWLTGDEKQLQV